MLLSVLRKKRKENVRLILLMELSIRQNVLLNAAGLLHQPIIPKLEGEDVFKGVKMHTARWDRSVNKSF
jgi:cation diffusion facilitator CzcD-associated flavoprotein CzcO